MVTGGKSFTEKELARLADLVIGEVDILQLGDAKEFADLDTSALPLTLTTPQIDFIRGILKDLEGSLDEPEDKGDLVLVKRAKTLFEKALKDPHLICEAK